MPYELKDDKLSRRLLNTFQIPLLVSLGLHVLLYIYGFPSLSLQQEVRNLGNRVRTIELNPALQRRLPDIDTGTDVPYFNSTPLEGSVLEEPVAPFALPLPPNFSPGDLPAIPLPPGYKVSELPSISFDIGLPPLGITDLSALPLPPPITDLDTLDSLDGLPELPEDLPPPDSEPPESEPESQVIAPPPEQEKSEPEEEKPTPEQIAAVRNQQLDQNLRDVSKGLQKSSTPTTNAEAQRNYVEWLSKIKQATPESITLVGTYPRDACIRRLEGQSVYGVVVDATNQIVAIDLLKGAQYSVFDRQAAQDVQKNNFGNESQELKSYSVTVDYKYNSEICPSLTLPSIRRKQEAESKPKPAPTPEEAKPTPEANPEPVPESKPEAETAKPEATETKPDAPKTEPESSEVENPQPEANQEPLPEPTSEAESEPKPSEAEKPLPSLRERLRNTPLPDDSTIRERLRRNPLPEK